MTAITYAYVVRQFSHAHRLTWHQTMALIRDRPRWWRWLDTADVRDVVSRMTVPCDSSRIIVDTAE